MWVDAGVGIFTFVAIMLGWWRGFLSQFLGVAGLVLAWLATPALSPWIGKLFRGRGYTAGSVAVASALLSFAVVLLVFRVAQGYLPEALERWSHGAKRLDSGMGAVLGGVRGLLFCWLVLSAGLLVQGTLLARFPDLAPHWRHSEAVRAARTYNPIAEVSLSRLARLRRALAKADFGGVPSRRAPAPANPTRRVDADAIAPITTPAPRRVARPPRGVLADPALRAAAKRRDWAALLADRRVEALLADDVALRRALADLK